MCCLPVTVEFEQVEAKVVQLTFRLLLLLLHVWLLRLQVRRQGGAGVFPPLARALQDENNHGDQWTTAGESFTPLSINITRAQRGSSSPGRRLRIWRVRRPRRRWEAT